MNIRPLITAITLLPAAMIPALAADIHKANNTTLLNDTASWVEGVLPGLTDIGVWDSTVTGANEVTLGMDSSWGGLRVTNVGGAVTIDAGNTLTLGSSGIDLSGATQPLTLNCSLAMGADQTWTVTNGQTLTLASNVDNTSLITALTIAGAGNVFLAGSLGSGPGGLVMNGSGTLTLSATTTSNYTGNTTVNGGRVVLTGGGLGSFKSTASSIKGGAVMQWDNTNAASFPVAQAYSGAGVAQKTGAGTLTIGNNGVVTLNQSAGGVLDIEAGDLNIGWAHGFMATNSGGLYIASGASYHSSDATLQMDWLSGSGSLNNAYNTTTPALIIGGAGTANNPAYGVSGNCAVFSGRLGYAETYNGRSVSSLSVVKTGAGNQTLAGSGIAYTGGTTVTNGTLSLSNTTAFASAVAVNAPGVLDLDGSWTLNTAVTGNGTVTKSGSGTTTVAAGQGYTGTTMVNGGTLVMSSLGAAQVPGAVLWLDASDPTTLFTDTAGTMPVANSGDVIKVWKDKTANHNDATLSGSLTGPTYQPGAQMGSSVARFNSTSSTSGNGMRTPLSVTSGSLSIFVVYSFRGTDTSGHRAVQGSVNWLMGPYQGKYQTYAGGFVGSPPAVVQNQFVVQEAIISGSTLTAYLNGLSYGTKSSPTYPGTINLGVSGGFAEALNGDLAELLVYNTPLTMAQRQNIEVYLAQKWLNTSYGLTSLNVNSAISVASGATFGGWGLAGAVTVGSGGTLSAGLSGVGTLTLSNLAFNGPCTLSVSPSSSSVPLNVTNALTLNGTVNLSLGNIPAPNTTNHILRFASLTGAGGFVLPPSRTPYTLQTNGNYLDLAVGALVYPLWTGNDSSEWSTNTIPSPKNWKQSSDSSPTDFLTGDTVVFDDTAANSMVNVSVANVYPLSVTFNNSSQGYTLQGSQGIAGSTGLLKQGAGTLTLANTNSFTGDVSVNGGTVSVATLANAGTNSPLGAGANVNLAGGTLSYTGSGAGMNRNIVLNGAGTIQATTPGALLTLSGPVSGANLLTVQGSGDTTISGALGNGAGGLIKNGAGTLTLAAANTFFGTSTINGGRLFLSGSAISSCLSPTTIVNSGGIMEWNNTGASAFPVLQHYSGAGVVRKTGGGLLTVGNPAGVILNQSVGGVFDVEAGDLNIGWLGGFMATNSGGLYIASGASYHISDPTLEMDWLSGSGDLNNAYNVSTPTVTVGGAGTADNPAYGVSNHTAVFSGRIGYPETYYNGKSVGTLNLVKRGSGTQVLAGANGLTGTTTVEGGTLEVDGSIGGGAVTVQSGATLRGTGTIGAVSAATVTVQSGGTLAPGTNDLSALYLNNALVLNAGSTVRFRLSKDGGTPVNSSIQNLSSVTYGGLLIVTNVTTDGTPLALGDTFYLFGGGGWSGVFGGYQLPPLANGLGWDTSGLLVNGSIAVANFVTAPFFSPPAGSNYSTALSVTIGSVTSGSIIHYTTDGTDPRTSGTAISGPSPITGVVIPANALRTITAYASKAGMADSLTVSATYATKSVRTWTNTAGGSWSDTGSWIDGLVGDGTGVTADFSTLTLSSDTYVWLDASRTLGGLVFGDAGSNYNWYLLPSVGAFTLDAGTNTPTITVSNQTATIGAPLGGVSGLAKAGSGTLSVSSGSATYSGNTTVNGGRLILQDPPMSWGAGSTNTVGGGTTFEFNANSAYSGDGFTPANMAFVGAGTFVKSGSATMNFTGPDTAMFMNFSPGALIDIQEGTVRFWYGYSAPDAWVNNKASLNIAAGCVVDLRDYPFVVYVDALTGGGNLTHTFGGPLGTVAVGVANGSGEFSGTISDTATYALALTKTGAGTQILSGANTYSGTTTVNGGTLEVDGTTGASSFIVQSGGVLSGTGVIGGAVLLQGTISPGAGLGTLTTADETWAGGGAYLFQLNSTTDIARMDQLVINGALTVTANPGNRFTVKLASLTSTNTPGALADFDPTQNYTWTIATATNGVSGFNPAAFVVDASAFANPHSGTFSVALEGNSVVVNYTAALMPPTLSGYGPLTGNSFPLTFTGPSGQTYRVLASTNVSVPLANWTVLTFGAFGGSPVSYTDTSATNQQRFYRIVSP